MASGYINLESTHSKLEGRIFWSSTSNGSIANTSNVYAEIQVRRNDGYSTRGTWNVGLTNAGTYNEDSIHTSVNDWTTIFGFTVNNVAHNDNGTGTCSISGWCYAPDGTSLSGQKVEGGATVTLDTIARKSNVTCADGNIGSATTININRQANSFKHTIKYDFSGLTGTIATKTSETSIGWVIPTSFYAKISNAKSGKGTITCETYSGDTLVGTSNCTFNAFVINSEPEVSATIEDANATTIALTGDKNKLVKYFSNAKVIITATAKNSATIKSQKVVCEDGKSATTTTSTLNNVESEKFTISAVDSRELSTSVDVNKTLVNYIKLAITEATLTRPSTISNIINAVIKGNYYNGNFGVADNTLNVKWRYRLSGATEWGTYNEIEVTITNNTFNKTLELGTDFDYKQAYEFEIVATDKLKSDTVNRLVTAGIPIIDIGEKDVRINENLILSRSSILKINENSGNSPIPESGCGIISGADGADSNNSNMKFFSWWSIGFTSSLGGAIPRGENAFYINCRNGNFTARGKGYTSKGEIPAPREVIVAGVNRKTWTVSGSWSNVSLLPFTYNNHSGNGKLIYTTNGIKIGKNVSRVLISTTINGINYSSFGSDVYFDVQRKRGTTVAGLAEVYNTNFSTSFHTMNITPFISEVQENDLIYLTFGSGSGGTGEVLGAWLCVEALE